MMKKLSVPDGKGKPSCCWHMTTEYWPVRQWKTACCMRTNPTTIEKIILKKFQIVFYIKDITN